MTALDGLFFGLSIALDLQNILLCLAGVLLGTLVGTLPGIGPMATISIFLPLTYKITDPSGALIFLAAIFYGAQYGSSTSAILLRMPGEPSSMMTALDGNELAKKGKAGTALSIAALSSFFAGIVSALVVAFATIPLSDIIYLFGPVEYTSLLLFGLIAAASLGGDIFKSTAMLCVGILLGMVGTDITTGSVRFAFGVPELIDGINFVLVAMGIFGLGEIFYNSLHGQIFKKKIQKLIHLYPSKKILKKSFAPACRGTFLGCILGILPGTASVVSAFAAYAFEKFFLKKTDSLGKGNIAGVAAPEAANNAAAQTSFVPLFGLGIPCTALMTLMAAAMLMHGVTPGPQLLSNSPQIFWGVVGSMLIGNLFLIILNFPLIRVWIRLLELPMIYVYLVGFLVCVTGTFYLNNNLFDVLVLLLLGLFGYILRVLDCSPAPLIMGMLLGPLLEENFKRALIVEQGNLLAFVTKPLSLVFLVCTLIFIIARYCKFIKKKY